MRSGRGSRRSARARAAVASRLGRGRAEAGARAWPRPDRARLAHAQAAGSGVLLETGTSTCRCRTSGSGSRRTAADAPRTGLTSGSCAGILRATVRRRLFSARRPSPRGRTCRAYSSGVASHGSTVTRRRAETLCELPVREHSDERVRERRGVARRDEKPRLAVCDEVGNAADAARHHASTAAERLHDDAAESLRARGGTSAVASSRACATFGVGSDSSQRTRSGKSATRRSATSRSVPRPTRRSVASGTRGAARAMPRRARRSPCSARARRRRARPAARGAARWRREERVEVHERRERRRRLCTELAHDARGEGGDRPHAVGLPQPAPGERVGERRQAFRSGEP